MVGITSALPITSILPTAGGNSAVQKSGNASSEELTPEEQQQVQELKARDQEVRAHEQAHATVGGPYAGQPTYEYQEGPDGRRYAVGGEVAIDASAVAGNPDATIRKMDIVIRAALAPAEPSPQDRQAAQQAQATRQQAQIEKSNAQGTEQNGDQESSNPNIASESATSNPFQSLIDAAIEQSKSDNEDISITQNETINIARQSPLLSQAISGYTEASRLA
jgi:hypothetical protein